MSYPPPSPEPSPQPGPPPGEHYQPQYAVAPPTNGKATASLVVGVTTLVLSWCCGLGVLGLVAIVLGAKARSEIRRSGGYQGGAGLATAGIATGAVAVLVGLLVIAAIVVALAHPAGTFIGSDTGVDI